MTTQNLNQDGIRKLRRAIELVDNNILTRAREVAEQADALDNEERENAAAAEQEQARVQRMQRLLQQERRDEQAELDRRRAIVDEEASQMAFIIDGEPAPMPDPEPQAPAEPAQNDPDGNGNDPGNPPTAVQPAVPAAPQPQNQIPWYLRLYRYVRSWRGLAWFLALILAALGFLIARVTYDPMWSNVNNGFWHGLLVFFWFVVLTAAGFFTGGWIGSTIEEGQNANRNTPAAA